MTMIQYVALMESSGYPLDNVFVPIKRIDMGLLNKVASQVPLYEYGDAVVKPKKSHKWKIVSSTETSEVDDEKCKEITDEIIVVSDENATGDGIDNPKKRGHRPKNVSQKESEKDDLFEK